MFAYKEVTVRSIKHMIPALQKLGLLILNAQAARKAYEQHLLSRAFLTGCICWTLFAGTILLQMGRTITLPGFVMTLIKIVSVFIGCCWIILPVLIYLEGKVDRQVHRVITIGPILRFLSGIALWCQAAQGRPRHLSQLPGAIIVSVLFGFVLFTWPISHPWQALLALAFFVNTIFYILFHC